MTKRKSLTKKTLRRQFIEPPVKDFTDNDSFNKKSQFVVDNIIGSFSVIGTPVLAGASRRQGDEGY